MNKSTVIALEDRAESLAPLTELLRAGARQLIEQAVETELQELLAAHAGRLLADGRAGVVRNGDLPEREIQTGLGPITVRIPKVRVKPGEPVTVRSALVPPYVRKTRSVQAGVVCGKELAAPARVGLLGQSHHGREIHGWNRG
ncbi:MAG: IS256 family transposase, partial [Nitrospira sp.]